jgi:hypothetical protein
MLFLDGSPHRWLNDGMPTLPLYHDATGRPLYGLFRTQEGLEGCFAVCQNVLDRFGLPVRFYLDRVSQFTTTRRGVSISGNGMICPSEAVSDTLYHL